jgi:hypothetical protein
MKTTRILAVAVLIVGSGLALYMAQAQQVGARRIDLQRHDLSVTGRAVVQTIVVLAPLRHGSHVGRAGLDTGTLSHRVRH